MSKPLMKDYTIKPWRKMSLQELTTPKNGRLCMLDHWWVVTPDRHVLFYTGSPQCNANEAIAKRILEKLHPGCTAEFVDVAYLPQRRQHE